MIGFRSGPAHRLGILQKISQGTTLYTTGVTGKVTKKLAFQFPGTVLKDRLLQASRFSKPLEIQKSTDSNSDQLGQSTLKNFSLRLLCYMTSGYFISTLFFISSFLERKAHKAGCGGLKSDHVCQPSGPFCS